MRTGLGTMSPFLLNMMGLGPNLQLGSLLSLFLGLVCDSLGQLSLMRGQRQIYAIPFYRV